MSQFQRRLNSVLGCLEQSERFVSVAILQEEPCNVHRPHQLIEQVAVAMSCSARYKGKMIGQRLFPG
jgi:hypothetical protein